MAVLQEYLDWRADVPFSVSPFNDVDNLILATFAYTDFDGIVPCSGETVSLDVIHSTFFQKHRREDIPDHGPQIERAPLLMDGMLSGARFGTLRACRYINEIDTDKSAQISAVTFLLDDGTAYVAFRGTDSTLAGWKEDFNLSYLSETPGQLRALKYLEETAAEISCPLRVGGHSKGGNFAVYASAFCSAQDRILSVYCNDGPGFRTETVQSDAYRRILPKLVSIIPDTSIIGLLLSSGAKSRVIRSSASGIQQHDPFTWCVRRDGFVRAELSEAGKIIDKTLDTWVDGMDDDTRKSFTDTVFSLFASTGAETFQEIGRKKARNAEVILANLFALPKDKQSELLKLARHLIQSGGQAAASELPDLFSGNKPGKAYYSMIQISKNHQRPFALTTRKGVPC